MPANFCRMPLLWNILRDEPDIQNIIHIGGCMRDTADQTRTPFSDPQSFPLLAISKSSTLRIPSV